MFLLFIYSKLLNFSTYTTWNYILLILNMKSAPETSQSCYNFNMFTCKTVSIIECQIHTFLLLINYAAFICSSFGLLKFSSAARAKKITSFKVAQRSVCPYHRHNMQILDIIYVYGFWIGSCLASIVVNNYRSHNRSFRNIYRLKFPY